MLLYNSNKLKRGDCCTGFRIARSEQFSFRLGRPEAWKLRSLRASPKSRKEEMFYEESITDISTTTASILPLRSPLPPIRHPPRNSRRPLRHPMAAQILHPRNLFHPNVSSLLCRFWCHPRRRPASACPFPKQPRTRRLGLAVLCIHGRYCDFLPE